MMMILFVYKGMSGTTEEDLGHMWKTFLSSDSSHNSDFTYYITKFRLFLRIIIFSEFRLFFKSEF